MKYLIPKEVASVLKTLTQAGHEAYIVGGSVRDLLREKPPKDWDATTNAKPEEIITLFPDSFYENDFGTVGVKVDPFLPHGKEGREHDIIEVTTYRTESSYTDRRRPDTITFANTLTEDLARRDFTINALAMDVYGEIIDPYNGLSDLKNGMLRAVGDANERFNEDALRMMRAVRLSAEMNFMIEKATHDAIITNAALIQHVSMERIRDEFSRVVMSEHVRSGIETLSGAGLLQHFLPELEDGIDVEQNHHHTFTVWEHNLRSCETCPSTKLSVKLAALMHDIGKPESKRGTGRNATFYNHEYIGERITRKALKRLTFPKKVVDHASLLVRNHMFYYSVDEVTEAAVRRVIKKVGLENMKDLMDIRIGDRLGSGTKKAKPYKLRHFEYMIDKVSNDPVNVKMLKLNGDIMIRDMGFKPGPQIGAILDALLADVIEDPSLNTLEILQEKARVLQDQELSAIRTQAKEKIASKQKEDDQKMRGKHWVK